MKSGRFSDIRLALCYAEQLYETGELSDQDYHTIIVNIENDYNKMVKELDDELLTKKINRFFTLTICFIYTVYFALFS